MFTLPNQSLCINLDMLICSDQQSMKWLRATNWESSATSSHGGWKNNVLILWAAKWWVRYEALNLWSDNVLSGQGYSSSQGAVITSMEQSCNDYQWGKIEETWERNLLHCYFIHHEYHMTSLWNEAEAPWWDASVKLSYGTVTVKSHWCQ